MTKKFVNEVKDLRIELDETKEGVLKWKQLRDQFYRETQTLEKDRGLGKYRYQNSIEDIIERSKDLEQAYGQIHQNLWNYDEHLAKQFLQFSDIEKIIHVGRLGETDKRDVMLADIEAKSLRVRELTQLKEQVEVEMAPAGVVNFIYRHLSDIQRELRGQIKIFVRHKASMVRLLEVMLSAFKQSNTKLSEQGSELVKEKAKQRAFECIASIKVISNKIMQDVIKTVEMENTGHSTPLSISEGSTNNPLNAQERFTYDAE